MKLKESFSSVHGVTARSSRPTKAAALLLATVLAIPAFFILTMVEAWMQ